MPDSIIRFNSGDDRNIIERCGHCKMRIGGESFQDDNSWPEYPEGLFYRGYKCAGCKSEGYIIYKLEYAITTIKTIEGKRR